MALVCSAASEDAHDVDVRSRCSCNCDLGVGMGRSLAVVLIGSCVGGGLLIGTPINGIAVAQAVSIRQAPAHTITVTLADNLHSYRLPKGEGLDVRLSGRSSFTWTEPESSNQAVLQRTGGSSGTTATATFLAVKEGRAEVTSVGSFICSEAGVCLPLSVVFQVTVSVVG